MEVEKLEMCLTEKKKGGAYLYLMKTKYCVCVPCVGEPVAGLGSREFHRLHDEARRYCRLHPGRRHCQLFRGKLSLIYLPECLWN